MQRAFSINDIDFFLFFWYVFSQAGIIYAHLTASSHPMTQLGPMSVYDLSKDDYYYGNPTAATMASTSVPAAPGRLLSIDHPFAANKLSASATAATSVTADYAVRNVSVALCHSSAGIPSVDEYFTGKSDPVPSNYTHVQWGGP